MSLSLYRTKYLLQIFFFIIAVTVVVRYYDYNTPKTDDDYILLLEDPKLEVLKPISSKQKKVLEFNNCTYRKPITEFVPKEEYWILQNYIPASTSFKCNESVTFATHADISMISHLVDITSRWKGPVSVAVYDSGKDFENTVRTIFNLRNCVSENVKNFVTFHIFFHVNNFPEKIPTSFEFSKYETPCNKEVPNLYLLPDENVSNKNTIPIRGSRSRLGGQSKTAANKETHQMYPVTFARNIAKSLTTTYFIFSSDIQLYPSVNMIGDFFKKIQKPNTSNTSKKKVYVVPVYEVEDKKLPETISELRSLINEKKALLVNSSSCKYCNQTSHYAVSDNAVVARQRHPMHWEPFYIGSAQEQILDDKLMPKKETLSTKIIEAYVMCLMDYEFQVLENAFLAYHPDSFQQHNFSLSKSDPANVTKIMTEYKKRYGKSDKCDMFLRENHNLRWY